METTSYITKGFDNIITGLVKLYDPETVVELGTQQGASAITIGKAMSKGKLFTFDKYELKYDLPPHGETHANLLSAVNNIVENKLEHRILASIGDAFEIHKMFESVDILHVDLCNFYQIVYRILEQWHKKVKSLILLEGGGHNSWQKKHGFQPFTEVLHEWFVYEYYDSIVFNSPKGEYALTVLVRRHDEKDPSI